MKAKITGIKEHQDGLEVTMVVFRRYLPIPNYQDNETDEQYANRVASIANEIDGFSNLHIGWAELKQEPDILTIPTVNEYDT